MYALPSHGLERVPDRDAPEPAPAEARRHERHTRPDEPVPVWVWLTLGHYHEDYRARGEAVSWTATQVWVRYIDIEGREGFVWVWANAVERRTDDDTDD